MKNIFFALSILVILVSCEKNVALPIEDFECQLPIEDHSQLHLKNSQRLEVLTGNRLQNIMGVIGLVKDDEGLWMGSQGVADAESGTPILACQNFMIASISKVFTATAILYYLEQEQLSLDDLVSKWLPEQWINKVANASESTIRHLLQHTSGIPDYYTDAFELARINKVNNEFTALDILAFTESEPTEFPIGQMHSYSNTNYLLLGLILEQITGQDLTQIYDQVIFKPLGLSSAHFSVEQPFPKGTIKGYAEIYPGKLIESQFLYQDEMGTGDGGISINIYDLFRFMEGLFEGKILSPQTLQTMQDWVALPDPDTWVEGKLYNPKYGLGLEYFETPYGIAFGHSGGVDGFASLLLYFPKQKHCLITFQNTVSYDNEARLRIIEGLLDSMSE